MCRLSVSSLSAYFQHCEFYPQNVPPSNKCIHHFGSISGKEYIFVFLLSLKVADSHDFDSLIKASSCGFTWVPHIIHFAERLSLASSDQTFSCFGNIGLDEAFLYNRIKKQHPWYNRSIFAPFTCFYCCSDPFTWNEDASDCLLTQKEQELHQSS